MEMGAYYARRYMLTLFLLFLSLMLTLILMIFIFPISGALVGENATNRIFVSFILSSMISNSIVFLHFSLRYGIPFRGGDWWEWIFGDKSLGHSVRNGLIGSAILISIFVITLLLTIFLKTMFINFLTSSGRDVNVDVALNFLINIVPAFEVTNIAFINYFFKNKQILFFGWMWKPLKLEFDKISLLISLTNFLVVSVLFCFKLLTG